MNDGEANGNEGKGVMKNLVQHTRKNRSGRRKADVSEDNGPMTMVKK